MSVPPTPPVGPPQGPLVTGQGVPAAAAPTPLAQPPDPVATLLQRAVDAARADAAIRQSGMGSLIADLEPALASPGLPPEVKAAIRQVLSLALATDPAPDAAALKAAIGRSGLFLEGRLAATPGAPPIDMKAAMLVLQQALVAAGVMAGGRPPKVPVPPPSRGGAVVGQAPRPAGVRHDDAPAHLMQVLGDETDQALARQTLHQLASLPDEAGGARWMFELPMLTPQGAAVAQFAVERDGAGGGAAEAQPSWRARFALDVPPLGPIRVHLRLHDGRSSAILWVERPDSLALLRDQTADLAEALAGDVTIQPGAPPAPQVPPPGGLVDRSS
ncbi:flagellar hook-length control protein FliK [Phenylobacterium sp.]|uniref:flagellar hook-length control protein FliK n=1 Tax=Phenylobacterium sp. TaxID=1871053 RepID=UPI002ED9447D